MSWDDAEVVVEGKGRACVICGGLVTPAHRLCGWHEWQRKMRPPAWDWLVQGLMRLAQGADDTSIEDFFAAHATLKSLQQNADKRPAT